MHTKHEHSRFQPCLRTIGQEQMRINPEGSQSISHSRDTGDSQAWGQEEKLKQSPQTKH